MAAGGLEVHHPLTPHSSHPNGSFTRPRRAIILRYQPSSEALTRGTLLHWRTGSPFTKNNYLVRVCVRTVRAGTVVCLLWCSAC
jgi:hypothetical protein